MGCVSIGRQNVNRITVAEDEKQVSDNRKFIPWRHQKKLGDRAKTNRAWVL